MSETNELLTEQKEFLAAYLPLPPPDHANGARVPASARRPFVTLTYASSLDGMISLAPGTRTTLSGAETKAMTHYLRLKHDAILIGAGTAIADDPGLNCRYPGSALSDQPRPVVVDSAARWDASDAKVLALAAAGQGKMPWVVSSQQPQYGDPITAFGGERLYLRQGLLIDEPTEQQHAMSRGNAEHFRWAQILDALWSKGISSVMIEGGASVISALLAEKQLVDSVIITIAPTYLGEGGVAVQPAQRFEQGQRVNAARLKHTLWKQFGADVVLCGNMDS